MNIYRLPNGTNIAIDHIVSITEFRSVEKNGAFETSYAISMMNGAYIHLDNTCRDELEWNIAKDMYWDLIREWEDLDEVNKVDEGVTSFELAAKPEIRLDTQPMHEILAEIGKERLRQIDEEHYLSEHDDEFGGGELAAAAGVYAIISTYEDNHREELLEAIENGDKPRKIMKYWPWVSGWCRPKNQRRDLVRAGALIVAELERLDRQTEKDPLAEEKQALIERLELFRNNLHVVGLPNERSDLLDELEDYGYEPAITGDELLHNRKSIDDAIAFLQSEP